MYSYIYLFNFEAKNGSTVTFAKDMHSLKDFCFIDVIDAGITIWRKEEQPVNALFSMIWIFEEKVIWSNCLHRLMLEFQMFLKALFCSFMKCIQCLINLLDEYINKKCVVFTKHKWNWNLKYITYIIFWEITYYLIIIVCYNFKILKNKYDIKDLLYQNFYLDFTSNYRCFRYQKVKNKSKNKM